MIPHKDTLYWRVRATDRLETGRLETDRLETDSSLFWGLSSLSIPLVRVMWSRLLNEGHGLGVPPSQRGVCVCMYVCKERKKERSI